MNGTTQTGLDRFQTARTTDTTQNPENTGQNPETAESTEVPNTVKANRVTALPETVGEHDTVELVTDIDGDKLVSCTECGVAVMPGSTQKLSDVPCEPEYEGYAVTEAVEK